MSFGPEMHISWRGVEAKLASFDLSDLTALPDMDAQRAVYLPEAHRTEWSRLQSTDAATYQHLSAGADNLHWGVFVPEDGMVGLVGYMGLGTLEPPQLRRMITGHSPKGIGSIILPFVSWYAGFEAEITKAQSLVADGHEAAARSIRRVGYFDVGKRPINGVVYNEYHQILDTDILLDGQGGRVPSLARQQTLRALCFATKYLIANTNTWPSAQEFSNLEEARRSLADML